MAGKLYAYVATSGEKIYVIDIATNTVSTTIQPFYETVVQSLAITPNGYLYATANSGESASIINTADNTVIPITTSVGTCQCTNGIGVCTNCAILGFAITPDGKYAYTLNNLVNNSVVVTEIATGAQPTPIPVGLNPFEIAITPDGKYAYVTNKGSNTISVIDTATNTVSSTIENISSPTYIVIIPVTSVCPAESVCGSNCCSSGQTCSDGACVNPSSNCGAYTCSAGEFCCGNTNCCYSNQTCCGKNCCYPNEECCNGICCNPGQTCNVDNVCVDG